MSDFGSFLESWNVFYTALAGGTAAVMGLIFLAVSLRLEIFARSGLHEPREVAWQTFLNFFWVFFISLYFLIPGNSQQSFGAVLAILSLIGLILVLRRWVKAHARLPLTRNIVAFVPLLLCYLALMLSGLLGIANFHFLNATAPVLVMLLGIAVNNAWELLFAYRKPENTGGDKGTGA